MKIINNFSYRVRVRFNEVDMHGHVFNGNYYTYFDSAITEFLKHTNLLKLSTDTFYVAMTQANYFAPIFFDEDIVVNVKIDSVGQTSMAFFLNIYRPKDEKNILTTGKVVWVNICKDTKSKKIISDILRAKVLSLQEAEQNEN